MSDYFDPAAGDLIFAGDQQKSAPSGQEWAQRVFADPLSLTYRIAADSFTADYISPEQEAALYLDWQTRDTELGYRLLDRRREELLRGVEVFQSALAKKRKLIALTRTRLDALQKINATEQNAALHHSEQIFSQLDGEVRTAQADLQILRYYIAPLTAINSLLQPMIGGASNEDHHLAEQRMRLFGQSWRGWMRVRAFHRHFTEKTSPLPDDPQLLFAGILIPHSAEAPSPLATDLIVPEEVVAYLNHYLEITASLIAQVQCCFIPEQRAQMPQTDWPALMMLLRAITEFFYFSGFELPLLSNNLIVDLDDPSKLWFHYSDSPEWQPAPAESLSNRIKRDAAMAAQLISSNTALLGWRNASDVKSEQLSASLARPRTGAPANLQPYRSTGLARLDIDPNTHLHKFQTSFRLTGRLLEQLVNANPQLQTVFNSSLGGPLETITGMARLDVKAFNLNQAQPLPDDERFQWLSQFWKRMGKRRPLILLGEGYAKELTLGLEALGEPSPERSSLLSIQLSNLLSRTSLSDRGAFQDLLTGLLMADQIRMVELLSATWQMISSITARINEVGNNQSTAILLKDLITIGKEHEEEIARRFHVKWLSAKQPIWRLVCACAPFAWEFWTSIAQKEQWLNALAQQNPIDALAALLRLCGDITRLLVLLESASPLAAERLTIDAEVAGRNVLSAFQQYQRNVSIIELIRFYYDPEVPHDAWIAFTSSFKNYLQQLHDDLKQFDSGPQSALFANAIKQLEINYPTPLPLRRANRKTGTASAHVVDKQILLAKAANIDENDARAIELLGNDLLAPDALDRITLLKLLALWQHANLRGALHYLAEVRQSLRAHFESARHRKLFFSAPSVLHDATKYFRDLSLQANADTLTSESCQQLQDYLNSLDAFHRFTEGALASGSFFQEEDRYEIGSIDSSSQVNLIIFAVYNRLFCGIVRERALAVLETFQDFLQHQAVGQLSDWRPEYLIIGSIGVRGHDEGLIVSGSSVPIDPIFSAPEKNISERLLVNFLRSKYQLVQALLKHEFPNMRIKIQN